MKRITITNPVNYKMYIIILRQYATHFGNTTITSIDTVDEAVSTLPSYS